MPGFNSIVADHRHNGTLLTEQHRGERHGHSAALPGDDKAAAKCTHTEPRIAANEDANLAELSEWTSGAAKFWGARIVLQSTVFEMAKYCRRWSALNWTGHVAVRGMLRAVRGVFGT